MVSTSNKRSLRIRTGPHDYGPREWGVFFWIHRKFLLHTHRHTRTPPLHLRYNLTPRSTALLCAFPGFGHMPGYVDFLGEGYGSRMGTGRPPPWRSAPRAARCFRACRSSIASASAICRS